KAVTASAGEQAASISVGSAASAVVVWGGIRAGIGQVHAMTEKTADTAAQMSHSCRQSAKLPVMRTMAPETRMPKPAPPYEMPPSRGVREFAGMRWVTQTKISPEAIPAIVRMLPCQMRFGVRATAA